MDIISIYFAGLSIISLFVYYLINAKLRINFLVFLSCLFVASFDIKALFYLLFFSGLNFYIGRNLPRVKRKRFLFIVGILINLVQIIILKYNDFAFSPIAQLLHLHYDIKHLTDIILTVGISYYTLQGLGYLINIYFGWEKPETKYLDFFLYMTFFPKFLSGPIERSNHFLPQLKSAVTFNYDNVLSGIKIAFWGFFKKVIIANHLSATVNMLYTNSSDVGALYVILVILVQPIYIYFDFSGYTDIAVGFARTFGIDLLPNFNRPFLSENVTTFWKRFHMSLSSWFNDYVFRPVSFRFRRYKQSATIWALCITWTLFGIWHGAGWNFMLLGFLQACAIIYEYFTRQKRTILFAKLPPLIKIWMGRIITYLFYGISLVFFFSPNLANVNKIIGKLRDFNHFSHEGFLLEPLLFGLFFSILFLCLEVLQTDSLKSYTQLEHFWNKQRSFRIAIYFISAVLLISQLSGTKSFIYEMF